jgi:hypothetical protein
MFALCITINNNSDRENIYIRLAILNLDTETNTRRLKTAEMNFIRQITKTSP